MIRSYLTKGVCISKWCKPKDMRTRITLLFSQMIVVDILICRIIFPKTSLFKVLSPRYKLPGFLGGFLEDKSPGVFKESNTVKDNHRDTPHGGNSLGLRDWIASRLSDMSQELSSSFPRLSLSFNRRGSNKAFLVTMFVFIIKCQLVLIKPSHAVKAMSNISMCDDSDDTMFFSHPAFTDSLLSTAVRAGGPGSVIDSREAIHINARIYFFGKSP